MKRQGLVKPIIGGTPLISSADSQGCAGSPDHRPGNLLRHDESPKAEKFVAELQPLLQDLAFRPISSRACSER
jgi:branched-chain amino acid transport system substrate-binding protein